MDINEFLEQDATKDILRFTTAGSVDDGKSTLIGRLLHDSKVVYEDQLISVKNATGRVNGESEVDYAFFTDGLKAEREQGITIDVAYRYFSTPRRKFIIADTPGHEQYTRNMATGASSADLAVILIDAKNGVLPQSKRHAFISSLLAIPHIIVAVNKMDLVEYQEKVFDEIRKEFSDFAAKLSFQDLHFIPVSALKGDNVVDKSKNIPWFRGQPLLDYLENVYIASDRNLVDLRFPIQTVVRSDLGSRSYGGMICSGVIHQGDEVLVLPSMKKTKIKTITSFKEEKTYSFAPQSTMVTLEDELDISRGDMLVHSHNLPKIQKHFEAMVVWMGQQPLDPDRNYLIKHQSRYCPARFDQLRYRIDINDLHRENAEALKLNEIGRVVLTSSKDIYFDSYRKNRSTGGFVLIDRLTNNTVAAGMILDRDDIERLPSRLTSSKEKRKSQRVATKSLVSSNARMERFKQRPATVWLTGLVSSGKKDIAYALEAKLFENNATCVVLDGGTIRTGISRELEYSISDRAENLRRTAEIARLLNDNGIIAICAFVSPYADLRRQVAEIVGPDRFIEVYVDASAEWCSERDQTGLYKKSMNGDLDELPGISSTYEVPLNPKIHLDREKMTVDEAVAKIVKNLSANNYYPLKNQVEE